MKKIFLLIFASVLFILLFYSCCEILPPPAYFLDWDSQFGQQWDIYSIPRKNFGWHSISQVFISSDEDKIFIRSGKDIFSSDDNGQTWTKKNNFPVFSFCISQNSAICYLFGTNNYNQYYLYKSADTLCSPTILYKARWNSQLLDCSADGSKVLMVPGSTSYFDDISRKFSHENLYVSNDGENFQQISELGSRDFSMVKVSPDGEKMIAGVYDGPLYFSSDAGNNWVTVNSVENSKWTSAVFSADNSKIYVTSYDGYVYFSNDSGITWSKLNSIGIKKWSCVDISSDGTYIYILEYGGNVYKSSDSGANWQQMNILGKRKFLSVRCSSDGKKVLIGVYNEQNALLFSQDYLNSTICLDSFGNLYDSNYVAGVVSDDCSTIILASNYSEIIKSINSGASWQEIQNNQLSSITHMVSSNDCAILALVSDNNLYISQDKAVSWQKVSTLSVNSITDLAISSDGSTIVLIGDNKIYFSRNIGPQGSTINWTVISNLSQNLSRCWVSYYGNTIVIAGELSFFISTSSSPNFQNISIPESGRFYCSISKNGKRIILGYSWEYGDYYDIIYSKDNGISWNTIKDKSFYMLELSNDGKIAVGRNYEDYLYTFILNNRYADELTELTEHGWVMAEDVVYSDDNSLIFLIDKHYLYLSTNLGKSYARTYYPAAVSSSEKRQIFLSKDNSKVLILSNSVIAVTTK
jgi:photosystem II stability/assembly factor-like uncharacterized protein